MTKIEAKIKEKAKMGTEIENMLDTDLEDEWKRVAKIQWVKLKDVLALQKDHEQKLEKQLNRLEAPRAGSIFTFDMEFGMRYVLMQQLGQDCAPMIEEAEKIRKQLLKRYETLSELAKLLKKRPRPPPYDLDSPYSRTWMKKYREYCDNIEEKVEELIK